MKSIMEGQQIIRSITAFFEDRGIIWNRVYIGVTNNAEKRLFHDHNVDRREDDYIVCQSRSAHEARAIEGYFRNLGPPASMEEAMTPAALSMPIAKGAIRLNKPVFRMEPFI